MASRSPHGLLRVVGPAARPTQLTPWQFRHLHHSATCRATPPSSQETETTSGAGPSQPAREALKQSSINPTSRPKSRTIFANIFEEEKQEDGTTRHRSQYNRDPFSLRPTDDHLDFPLVDGAWLAKQIKRPRRVRMLTRDFIHDALYNPHYGYFSRHAVLLPDGQGRPRSYDFAQLADERAFMAAVERRYADFEESIEKLDRQRKEKIERRLDAQVKEALGPVRNKGKVDKSTAITAKDLSAVRSPTAPVKAKLGSAEALDAAQRRGRMDLARQIMNEKENNAHDRDVMAMAARQVWHTPTELFKPHFAHAVANYMIQHRLPDQPLRIYEVGAGSGALAHDILDYLEQSHPDIYRDTKYHIIEISPRLAAQQKAVLSKHMAPGAGRVQISNESALQLNRLEPNPCFFLAMEVFDNLTHDVVRYASDTLQPYQGLVSIDANGDMHELWEPVQDPTVQRYLDIMSAKQRSSLPVTAPWWMALLPATVRRGVTRNLPFYPNLLPPHYIPTGSLQLLDVLANKFPQHRLVMADFDALPESLAGHNAPVVQTRLNGTMIPVTTYTVHQGFFDIFFPTNFDDLRYVHQRVMEQAGQAGYQEPGGKGDHRAEVVSHKQFLQRYADADRTTCRDGSNPMLSWYANASWFLS